jgi:aryl-alcohol dehydrogenase-like predicted oxidoreductase
MPTSSSSASSSRRYVLPESNTSFSSSSEADAQYPEYKSKVVVVLKGGSGDVTKEMTAGLDRNREMIQHATELLGKKPEVYSLARLPPDLSFEETFKNMKILLDEGLFGAFGASEMKRESLERAQKVGPLFFLINHPLSHLAYVITLCLR